MDGIPSTDETKVCISAAVGAFKSFQKHTGDDSGPDFHLHSILSHLLMMSECFHTFAFSHFFPPLLHCKSAPICFFFFNIDILIIIPSPGLACQLQTNVYIYISISVFLFFSISFCWMTLI